MAMSRRFTDLSEPEVLALAISLEEEDARIYADFAERLGEAYPATVEMLRSMAAEEREHARRLTESFHANFGPHIPLIRRGDVRGFIPRKPIWLLRSLSLQQIRHTVDSMEAEAARFYLHAAQGSRSESLRHLLEELAREEDKHVDLAGKMTENLAATGAIEQETETERKTFVLQVIQPGLAGLMDGSVSTLAPVFAAAFATRDSWDAFVVGLAASIGAGISMGFAEALSDDGIISGRGRPWMRGLVCGLMTTLGGIGHTLPFLVPNFMTATAIAVGVVVVELAIISWIRHKYMDTPLLAAGFQVMVGGLLVFLVGILIGSA